MYGLGLRRSEARRLQPASIDSRKMVVRAVGKGNRERAVPLPGALLVRLRGFWLTHRNAKWLFPGANGEKPFNPKSFYEAFRSARDRAGLGSDVTPHTLRHSYATHLLENGVSAGTVQILLGHSSRRSTQIYTHLTEAGREELRGRCDRLFGEPFSEGAGQ